MNGTKGRHFEISTTGRCLKQKHQPENVVEKTEIVTMGSHPIFKMSSLVTMYVYIEQY